MTIEYDGADFAGWQRQVNKRSVQGCLEEALTRICGTATKVVGAGRTDSGVHATGQVAHFDSRNEKPIRELKRSVNAVLDRDVVVREVEQVPDTFHARYSAISRRYGYLLLTSRTRSPLRRARSWHTGPLDVALMRNAAALMEGVHDFAPLGRPMAIGAPTVRHVFRVAVSAADTEVEVEVEANAFLRHQVRRMVGLLVAVGRGAFEAGRIEAALGQGEPLPSFRRAPAQGLCLERVAYPDDPSEWRTRREAENDNAEIE